MFDSNLTHNITINGTDPVAAQRIIQGIMQGVHPERMAEYMARTQMGFGIPPPPPPNQPALNSAKGCGCENGKKTKYDDSNTKGCCCKNGTKEMFDKLPKSQSL